MARKPARKKKFTDAYVHSLRPKEHTFRVWDTHVPGLVLRVWPSGKKSFYVDYRCRGRRGFHSIGRYPTFYVAEARVEARDALNKAARGIDPAAHKQAQRGTALKDVHKRYLVEHAMKRNKSWQQGKFLIERFVLPRLGGISVKDVSRADVRAVFSGIEKPVLANQVLAAASAVFTWAAKQDLVTANPCKGIDRNPTNDRERTLYDDVDELRRLWAALDRMGTPQARALKAILLTGQRPGEVSCMRFDQIHDNWWLLAGQETPVWPGTKNKKNHRIWLPEAARAVIRGSNVTSISGYAFSGAGSRPVDNLDAVMRAVCEQLGISDKVRPHDLRRTFLTTVTALKFGRHLMDVIANHQTKTTTDVYDRYSYSDEIKQVMEAVADHIVSLARGDGAAAIASR